MPWHRPSSFAAQLLARRLSATRDRLASSWCRNSLATDAKTGDGELAMNFFFFFTFANWRFQKASLNLLAKFFDGYRVLPITALSHRVVVFIVQVEHILLPVLDSNNPPRH